MANPFFKTGKSEPNSKTDPHSKQTEDRVKHTFKRSFFPYKSVIYDTMRYGENIPFASILVNPNETWRLHFPAEVKSDTLASPLMTGISFNQDYAFVPFPALMPNSYEIAFRQQAFGDDVPKDCYPSIELSSMLTFVDDICSSCFDIIRGKREDQVYKPEFQEVLCCMLLLEDLFSSSSLLRRLGYAFDYSCGYHADPTASVNLFETIDIDSACEKAFANIVQAISEGDFYYYVEPVNASVNGAPLFTLCCYKSVLPQTGIAYRTITFKDKYSFIKHYLDVLHSGLACTENFSKDCPTFSLLCGLNSGEVTTPDPEDVVTSTYDRFNLAPLFSYHLACWQFFVRNSVDKINSAELWKTNMHAILRSLFTNSTQFADPFFAFNGTSIMYDYLSGYYYQPALEQCAAGIMAYSSGLTTFVSVFNLYRFLFNLFSHQKTLFYGDRFSNARVRALGISDEYGIELGENATAVDVTGSVTFQRFRNKVAKLGNSIENQVKGFFNIDTPPDYHYPQFIGSCNSAVSGFEVANTAEDTGYQVTRINSNNGAPEFEFSGPAFYGYIIGIASFSAPYAYSRPCRRDVVFGKRDDFYNPDFQFLGDDAIRPLELKGLSGSVVDVDTAFAYEQRDNFYKVATSDARGAFVSLLRSWAFVPDTNNDVIPSLRSHYRVLCPEFIRCHPLDFDRFFPSLASCSYANWYHFIVKITCDCSANRVMVKHPTISLG